MNTNDITVRAAHVTSDAAHADVAAVLAQADMSTAREIHAGTAVTIASWWQSPGRVGSDLAAFASGATVDRSDVLADIAATRPEVTEPADNRALDCLATFVIRLPYPEVTDTSASDIPDAAYMSGLSDERREFLTGQLQEALAAASYWCHVSGYLGGEFDGVTVRVDDDGDDYDGTEHVVTLRTMARGYRLLSMPDTNFYNSGYRPEHHGATHVRIGKFNRSNGMDADADAWDSDAALQLGLFGTVVFG